MSDRKEYDRWEHERYREGGELVECRHCEGRGDTYNKACCEDAAGVDHSTSQRVVCCSCGGSGKRRI